VDPIYQIGASASINIAFRSSQITQQRQERALSESTDNKEPVATEENATDNSGVAQVQISNAAIGMADFTDRVMQQADRIEQRFQQPLVAAQLTSNAPVDSGRSFEFSMSSELQTYMQMIRQLSKDEESFDRFIDRMDSYLNGDSDQELSFDEFVTQVGEEFGFSSVSIEQSYEINFQSRTTIQNGERIRERENAKMEEIAQSGVMQEAEPLVFDLDGDGLELTTAEDGVEFDITGDGKTEQTAFVTGDDAFLSLDRNGNGTIDSGKELFGDQHGAKNGIEELRKFDDNNDGVIDKNDAVFDQLRLFIDRNGDGASQSNELVSLHDEGISKISLDAKDEDRRIAGNRMAASTWFERNSGSRNLIGEMYLNYMA
jgi:hypothetical protein